MLRGDELLTVSQAARLLGVAQETLRGWANRGRIEFIRIPGGPRLFRRDAMERIARARPTLEPRPPVESPR